MANRRVLVKRRKSVRNIRKITRTMQLIATARFQAAFNRAMATKPYTQKLAELVADLSRAAGSVDHPLLQTHDDVPRSALVVITSDRGLAGGEMARGGDRPSPTLILRGRHRVGRLVGAAVDPAADAGAVRIDRGVLPRGLRRCARGCRGVCRAAHDRPPGRHARPPHARTPASAAGGGTGGCERGHRRTARKRTLPG